MTKHRITGPDALAFLNRLVTRDVAKIKPGKVGYCVWCDDNGQVIDDGTIFHLREGDYRLCSQERQLEWLSRSAHGFDVSIVEDTHDVAALALQGPTSCAVLKAIGCVGIEKLAPFGIAYFPVRGRRAHGFAHRLHGRSRLRAVDRPGARAGLCGMRCSRRARIHGIRPMGTHALEVARIEAGFIQAHVDFLPADQAIRPGPFTLAVRARSRAARRFQQAQLQRSPRAARRAASAARATGSCGSTSRATSRLAPRTSMTAAQRQCRRHRHLGGMVAFCKSQHRARLDANAVGPAGRRALGGDLLSARAALVARDGALSRGRRRVLRSAASTRDTGSGLLTAALRGAGMPHRLEPLLRPRSVAVLGATERDGTVGRNSRRESSERRVRRAAVCRESCAMSRCVACVASRRSPRCPSLSSM